MVRYCVVCCMNGFGAHWCGGIFILRNTTLQFCFIKQYLVQSFGLRLWLLLSCCLAVA